MLMPFSAQAAPSTPNIIGSVTHGQSVTLSGTGFGSKSTSAPLMWDPVDGMYTSTANTSVVPVGGANPWAAAGFDEAVHFKTTNPRGKWTSKYTNTGSSSAFKAASLGGNRYDGLIVMYVSWWTYSNPTSCVPDNASNKYARFTDDASWEAKTGFVFFIWEPTLANIGPTGGNNGEYLSTCFTGWHRMEVTIDNAANPGPDIRLALDNAPHGTQPLPIEVDEVGIIDGIYMMGFDGSNTDPQDQPTIDWGEIYVDNTRARVEICNNAVKSSATHCEIQIPSAWSTTSITATVNQGSFADNSTAYLFVIDSSGASSATGQSITFGAGAAPQHAISRGARVAGGVVR